VVSWAEEASDSAHIYMDIETLTHTPIRDTLSTNTQRTPPLDEAQAKRANSLLFGAVNGASTAITANSILPLSEAFTKFGTRGGDTYIAFVASLSRREVPRAASLPGGYAGMAPVRSRRDRKGVARRKAFGMVARPSNAPEISRIGDTQPVRSKSGDIARPI